MNRYFRLVHAALFAAFCSACQLAGATAVDDRIKAFERGLRPAVDTAGEPVSRWSIEDRMAHHHVPGVSIAVLQDGKIAWTSVYGVTERETDRPVDAESLFSVGSLSKVVAAAVTLRLADAGRLNLDADVNRYLRRWKLPLNEYTAVRPVTLRGVLSHTSGLNVHGFPDFEPQDRLPTVIDTLEGRPPAKTDTVRPQFIPGTAFRYSGGGVTVEQLVIEEITGKGFATAARMFVLDPLGMDRSSFVNPLPGRYGNVAKPHDDRGIRDDWEVMPEAAASGLWTTPREYARVLTALLASYRDGDSSFLSQSLVRQMFTPVGPSRYGLGPLVSGIGKTRYIAHSGSNSSYKAWMEAHLDTGNGLVVFTNGAGGSSLRFEIRRAIAAAEGWDVSGSVEVDPCWSCAGPLRDFVGLYRVKEPDTLQEHRVDQVAVAYEVTLQDDTLYFCEAPADCENRLLPEDSSNFISVDDAARVEFLRGYTGEVVGLLLDRHGYKRQADRIAGRVP